VNAPNVPFNFTWALVGVTSYTFQPSKYLTLHLNTSANVVCRRSS
jgi:hypothetical protein